MTLTVSLLLFVLALAVIAYSAVTPRAVLRPVRISHQQPRQGKQPWPNP